MGTGGSLVVIDFSELGNSAHFRRVGWSEQEPDRVWGVGPRSALRIPIQAAGRPMVLEAEIEPHNAPLTITGQIVRVLINGIALGIVRLNCRSMIRCEIAPPLHGPDGIQQIEFGCPGFYRPEFGPISQDHRPLSVSFFRARLYTTDLFKPGPHFPTIQPNVPVIGLLRPVAEVPNSATEAAAYTFGSEGTALPWMRDGWDGGESTFTWAVETSCGLELPAPKTPGSYVLRLDGWPLIVPGEVTKQDVTVALDGVVIAQFSVREPFAWVMPLPSELIVGRSILPLAFILPDARRPVDTGSSLDTRMLSIAFTRIAVIPLPSHLTAIQWIRAEQAGPIGAAAVSSQFLSEDGPALQEAIELNLGLNVLALARGFESLGDNCEFGIVQQKLGLEVLNIFRFCNAKLPDLISALTDDLRAVSDPSSVTVNLNDADPREYVLSLPAYNLHWHTFSHENEADSLRLWRDHTVKLAYLRRKFYEGLRAGQKTYVIKHSERIPLGRAAALLLELNRHGRATLLCVEPASGKRRPGEVELVIPGLMRGYLERFAPEACADSADPADWLRVLGNATLLNRGPNAIVTNWERTA
jgi:hypothetical protein